MTGQQCDQDATVYDATGETIGTLPAHDAQDGYLMVRKGTVFPKDLYIPVTTVQSTDAAGNVYLSLHNDDLAEARDDSPPVGATASDAQTATVAETTTTRARRRRPRGLRRAAARQSLRPGPTTSLPSPSTRRTWSSAHARRRQAASTCTRRSCRSRRPSW